MTGSTPIGAGESTTSTFCRICEARCGIDVTVRDGAVVRIGPDKQNPYSWRDFCSKGRSAAEVLTHPRRLRWPMRRVGDTYERASWDDAVDDIAARLTVLRDRHGPDAVASYLGNPVGFNGANGAWFGAFVKGMGTKNVYSVSSVDQNNLQRVCFEMYGRWLVPLIPDVDDCDFFLLIGMNPAVSTFGWIHNVPDGWRRTLARQSAGATVVVVDPNHTDSAARADRHLAVRPGQDWALLLGMLVVILRDGMARIPASPMMTGLDVLEDLARDADVAILASRCGIPADTLAAVAREFAGARTAMCVAHTGLSHGGEGVVAEWLTHVLNAVTGRLDASGGRRFEPGFVPVGTMFGTRPAAPSRVRGLPALAGARSLAELADEITTPGDGQVKALLCNSGNPVLSSAHGHRLDAALGELDLLVVQDLVQRESHRHAHWLLPGTHYLEREDLLAHYSSFEDQPFAQLAQAAVAPPPDVREEWEFWRDLAVAMNIPAFGAHTATMNPRQLWQRTVEGGGRLSWPELISSPHGTIYAAKTYGALPTALATSDGAVHLAPEAFVDRVRALMGQPVALPSTVWPLVLSNQRSKTAMNSWLNETPSAQRRHDGNVLLVNPIDAEHLSITSGDRVRVSSKVASLECTAAVSTVPRRGVVVLEHGWGSRVFHPDDDAPPQSYGVNRNLLVDDLAVDPLSGTPAFGTAQVRVDVLSPSAP